MTVPSFEEWYLIGECLLVAVAACISAAVMAIRSCKGAHVPTAEEIKLARKIEQARKLRRAEKKDATRARGVFVRYSTGAEE